MRTSICTLLCFLSAAALWAADASGPVQVDDLRCEYAVNPIGLDVPAPRLSWRLISGRRGERQTAYQIQAATTPDHLQSGRPDLWDTGRIISDRSVQVAYGGPRLKSRQKVYWRVRVWDKDGRPTPYSALAHWEMGLLDPADWKAGWIGYPEGWPGRPLYFRRDLRITKEVRQARAYVAGLGYYELRINGQRVGDHVLDPGWTDYSKRVLYVTYDVGGMLRQGNNAIAAVVGQGRYGMPKLLLQVEVQYADGTAETIYTRGGHGAMSWRVTSGPILASSVFDGETYDARLEKPGWDSPEGKLPPPSDRTEGWTTAVPVEPPGGRLIAQKLEPIRVVQTLSPVKLSEPKPGLAVYDTGQNLAGWAELRVSGPRATRVTLRFAENLYPDGTVNQENLRKAAATDVYILKGEGLEIWEPKFTYHGFRYVQVEGLPQRPTLDHIQIKVVRSAVEAAGKLETSNDLINRIQKMVWWTEASNLHSVPTDCPQRDERQGWMNDLTVRLEEMILNFEVPRFLTKFLDDVRDTQQADGAIADTVPFRWGQRPADPVSASFLLLAWLPYEYYDDTRLIQEHFDAFKAWVDFLWSKTQNGIVTYGYYGDWSPPRAFAVGGLLGIGANSKDTPERLMSTGYLYYSARITAHMASALQRPKERARYEEIARRVAEAFQREYWNEKVGGYGANNQAANSFALYLGLVPKERVPRVVENLVKDVESNGFHLTTGNLCTKYLLEALSEHGRSDVAYRIATQTTYPSWGYMLDNGATTLWERWEHMTGGQMNSHNHPMMGSVSAWFYRHLAGIQPDPEAPGFRRFLLKPQPVEGLDWVLGEWRSPYGLIRSSWRRTEKGLAWEVVVPPNSAAEVWLPAARGKRVTESGRKLEQAEGVRRLKEHGDALVLEVSSGSYEFTIE
jgi:alpha-L-rhamnosidase